MTGGPVHPVAGGKGSALTVLGWRALVFLLTTALLLALGISSDRPARAADGITEYTVLTAHSGVNAIIQGPDGNLWFAEGNASGSGHQIGRITPSGSVSEWALPGAYSQPISVAAGPDGRIWFDEYEAGGQVGHINVDGSGLTELPIPNGRVATGVTGGPDGNVWVAMAVVGSAIDRITPAGSFTEFALDGNAQPLGITAGPDGNLWFTEVRGMIGRITTTGAITEFPIPTSDGQPTQIAAGPDGNLWFTERNRDKIGRITPAGVVTEFGVPTAFNYPYGIAAGPDGQVWFTESGYISRLGRIDPGTGTVVELTLQAAGAGIKGIAAGPAGSIWFTESARDRIGVLSTPYTFLSYGGYNPTDPTRILDTRDTHQRLGPGQTLDVRVAGWAGVPASAAAAVLNAAAVNPSAPSYLTIYPTGSSRPTASNLNFGGGQTIANLVQVALGPGGYVSVYNQLGSTDVVLDLNGWFDAVPRAGTTAGQFVGYGPTRLLDTRTPLGGHQAKLGPGESLDLQIAGTLPGVHFPSGLAVVLNLTATGGSDYSYLAVYPKGVEGATRTSNVNFPPGRDLPNRAQVRLSSDGAVTIYNSKGTVDVVVDLSGWYLDGQSSGYGGYYHPLVPVRLVDTRPATQVGPVGTPLAPRSTTLIQVTGQVGVPMAGLAQPMVLNVTVTNSGAGSFLTLFPGDGTARPTASDLNYVSGETIPNLVVVHLGVQNGMLAVYNENGYVDLVVDVQGWYG